MLGCVIRSSLVGSLCALDLAIFLVTIVMVCAYVLVCVFSSLINLVCHFFYVVNLYNVLDLDR